MKNLFKGILIVSVAVISLSACKKNKSNDPSPTAPIEVGGGDEENITRVVLFLANDTEKDTVTFNDPTGKGTNVMVDSLILKVSTSYLVEVKIYDDTKTPTSIVSNEILSEANFHRFHYTFASTYGTPSLVTIITDQDNRIPPQPLGLRFDLLTGANVGNGKFKVSLRHFAGGAEKTSDPAGGDSDISIEFPVRIK